MMMTQKASGSTGESAEQYRERLASYIEGKDHLSIQRLSPTKLADLIARLSPEQLASRPADGKWSIVEILVHLADDEIATYWRYRQMIEHDGAPLSGFDQELWARLGNYQSWSSDEAFALFQLLRKANLRMLESLSSEQWERSGDHTERGKLTVADLARHMAAHDINHLRQIERLLPKATLTDEQEPEEQPMSSVDDETIVDPNVALTLQETAELLQRMPVVLRELILALPNRAVGYHPGPGKWCIKQVVGHLTEEDKRDFVGRIALMLRQRHPRLDINDQNAVALDRHDCDKDIFELLDEFASVRKASLRFVEQLSASDLERTGMHPKIGLIRVRELLHEWLYHDLNHFRQIEQNAQRLMWNQLGNMQGFYAV